MWSAILSYRTRELKGEGDLQSLLPMKNGKSPVFLGCFTTGHRFVMKNAEEEEIMNTLMIPESCRNCPLQYDGHENRVRFICTTYVLVGDKLLKLSELSDSTQLQAPGNVTFQPFCEGVGSFISLKGDALLNCIDSLALSVCVLAKLGFGVSDLNSNTYLFCPENILLNFIDLERLHENFDFNDLFYLIRPVVRYDLQRFEFDMPITNRFLKGILDNSRNDPSIAAILYTGVEYALRIGENTDLLRFGGSPTLFIKEGSCLFEVSREQRQRHTDSELSNVYLNIVKESLAADPLKPFTKEVVIKNLSSFDNSLGEFAKGIRPLELILLFADILENAYDLDEVDLQISALSNILFYYIIRAELYASLFGKGIEMNTSLSDIKDQLTTIDGMLNKKKVNLPSPITSKTCILI
jgi:hypothetical protein